MKKRILIVAGVFPPEPIVSAKLMFDMALALSQEFEVTVLRPRPTRPKGFIFKNYDNNDFPFKVIELASYTHPQSDLIGRFKESISSGREAAKYIELHHEDIDFIYNDPWQLFGVSIVARKAVKHGIPYMMAVQDIYPESLSSKLPNFVSKVVDKILLPIDRYNQKNAVRVHTISDKMVDYLSSSRGIDKRKYISIRNWQNEEDFIYESHDKRESDSIFTFMYMGNIGPLAGLDNVIDAFKIAKLENVRLIIAGAGSAKDSLKYKVKSLGLDNVEFRSVPEGKVAETQSMADVMLLPVRRGFAMSSIPSKLPAYMFSKKPILASVDSESDTAKCIIDSDAGWVVEPENVEVLAKKMIEIVISDSIILKTKGDKGYRFAIENLSKKNNLPRLINTIKEILI